MTSGNGKRSVVLVIDDDRDFRELVAFIIESQGLRVACAGDCQEGVDILRRGTEQLLLVLLDYYMPGMAPVQCASALVELVPSDVPVVLVTAAVNAARLAAELGLPKWLAKPFDLEDLREILRAAQTV